MLSLELTIDYADEKSAEAVLRSLGPDNEGYVESGIDGKTIWFKIEADNAGTMRNTADDLIACIKAAEETIGIH